VVINCREFTYSTDAQLQADMTAWFTQLRVAGVPVRDFRINFIATNRVLITTTYGLTMSGAPFPIVEDAPM
jgi:hypothetical protein